MSEESSVAPDDSQPTASAPGDSEASRPAPVRPWWRRRTAMIAAAAVVLAAAGTAVAVRLTSPSSQAPQYALLADPCALVDSATLARYLPGTSSSGPLFLPGPSPSNEPETGGCFWYAPDGNLVVGATIFGSGGVQQGFNSYVQAASQGGAADRPVSGLGDQATAVVKTVPPETSASTGLYVRSGNELVAVTLSPQGLGGAATMSAVTAIVRDALANLAQPPPLGPAPRYVPDYDPCHILSTAVPRYLPGATPGQDQPSTTRQPLDTCSWSTPDGARTLLASADIYGFVTGPHGAEQAFSSDVRSSAGTTDQQPVTGLGDRALAVFQTIGNWPTVQLFVWSSNAEVKVNYTSNPDAAGLSRGAQLAAAIAIARDLLAGQLTP